MDATKRRGKTGKTTQAQGETMPEEQYAFFEEHAESVQEAPGIYHVPDRRGALPGGWRWTTLREIAEIVGGITKGQKRRPDERTRLVPYLRVANVQRGYLDLTEVKLIEAREPEIQALQLQPGDMLFNEGGDRDKLGRGWIWNGELPECIHQNHVFRARLRDTRNSPKFISFYSNSAGQKYFWDEGKHTTNLASINLKKLGALPIPLPPAPEQQRIVAELEKQFTRLEAGAASLQRVQAALKRYRASVLQAACEGRLVPTEAELARRESRSYEAATALLVRILEGRRSEWRGHRKYKDPIPLGHRSDPIPEGWTWATVDQLASLVTDGDHNPPKRQSTGVPHLTAKNVRGWHLDASDCTFISSDDAARVFKRYYPIAGDLIVTCVGTVGRTAIVPSNFEFSPDRNLAAIRPATRDLDAKFLNCVLSSPRHQKQIASASGSTAQPHLYLGDLRGLAIPVPPLAEQHRIVAEVERRLSVIDRFEVAVVANLRRAARLRQAILHRAFSGKL